MNTTKTVSSSVISSGDIFYVAPQGTNAYDEDWNCGRPAIVISNPMMNELSSNVEVVYLTTHPQPGLPIYVEIKSTTRRSWAFCDKVYSISKKRLGKYINTCTEKEMTEIIEKVALTLATDSETLKQHQELLIKRLAQHFRDYETSFGEDYTAEERDLFVTLDDVAICDEAADIILSEMADVLRKNFKDKCLSENIWKIFDEKQKKTCHALSEISQERIKDVLTEWYRQFDSKKAKKLEKYITEKESEVLKTPSPAPEHVPETKQTEPAPTMAAPVNIETMPEYITMKAERDVYKRLYEELLAKK